MNLELNRSVARRLKALPKTTVFFIGLGLLSGCSAMPPSHINAAAEQTTGMTERTIMVATTRQKDPTSVFSGDRSIELNFGRATLLVPPNHKPGATDFTIREAAYIDRDAAFLQALNQELRARPRGKRQVVLFIHGYNTSFVDSVFRLTQITQDLQTTRVPVLFSWASRASVSSYVYDLNSATIARDGLERTIRLLFQSEAEEINILAHSMGNWVTVEALRQIVISGKLPNLKKLGYIILAAPDIDVDVFKSQMRRIGPPRKPFLVMISKDDLALRVSSLLAGGQKRIGAIEDAAELNALGAVVIDLSDVVSTDRLSHGKFADLAKLGPNLPSVMQQAVDQSGAQHNGGVFTTAVSVPLSVLGAPIKIITGQR